MVYGMWLNKYFHLNCHRWSLSYLIFILCLTYFLVTGNREQFNWLGPTELVFYLRVETESILRNVVSNKNWNIGWCPETLSLSVHVIIHLFSLLSTPYIILREEHKPQALRNKVLRNVCRPKNNALCEQLRTLHNENLRDLYRLYTSYFYDSEVLKMVGRKCH
jgi:hypothetical protein